jgi:hypothetical protein
MASNESSTSNAAFSAYLKPLLKKHALGQLLTYDDLMQAWDAAVRLVRCPVDALVQVSCAEYNIIQCNAMQCNAIQFNVTHAYHSPHPMHTNTYYTTYSLPP